MADENIVTNIVANADFSNLIADVHKVTASLSKMQQQIAGANKNIANQIRAMNNAFSDTIKSTGQYSTHFVSLTSDVEKFGRNLDSGKLKLGQYFGTMQQHTKTSGGLIRDLAKQQVALQNAVLQPLGKNAQGLMQFNVQVPRGLDVIKNKTAIANQELQIMNKVIQQGAGQLINWGKNTQWAGRQLTVGLTVPLAAFGKASADAFRAADAELVRLTKVYGGLAATSSSELGKVRKEVSQTANELAKAYGLSFKDSIGLAADIAATGKTGKDLIGSLQQTSRLAVLGEVDRQEALKATLALQNAFKQNTEDLTKSIDFLNAVENQTSTSLADLIEAIPKAGPIFKGLGGDVKDLSLMLVAMKEGGVNATEGANALKSGLASLINPTKVAVATFKDFGINLNDIVNSNAGDVTGMILGVQSAIDKLDPLSKQRAIEQLFGKFQFARMNALFENLGKQGSQTLAVMDLMKASSEDLAGIAGRELSQVTESASGKYRRALEGLKADLAGVGEGFLNIQTKFINIIDAVVKFAGNLPGPVKQILGFLGGLTAVVGPLLMLTGVLANFFGYIVKGAASLRMLFKGQSGWKLLTPEILAAQKAGSLMEQTFYSDAKAADVLRLAVGNLTDQFSILQAKVNSGSISVAPALSTIAGNVIQQGGTGGRVVNPNHPLVGAPYSRASTHMVARADLTEQQRLQQTMFGLVPGSGPVNQKIGTAPQIYMNDELPNVPGLTRVNGVSTGVVAGEAAKFHAMTATLGMQSKAEIASLRKTIAATGTVSKEFMGVFDDILPAVTAVTNNAARESAAIVAQLQSGAINVQQARAQIIELNLRIEQMIAQTVSAQAATMGRTINPTMVPLLDQPVVDATGKSNMRELFKKGKTKDLVNKVAGVLGVRTSGAGYNIETTRPRKFKTGGTVYRDNGSPGPELKPMGTDTVPAMLTPGEFVVKASSVNQETLPFLESLNEKGSAKPFLSATMIHQGTEANQALAGNRPGVNLTGSYLANDMASLHSRGLHPMALFYDQGVRLGYNKPELKRALNSAYTELQTAFKRRGDTPINNAYYEKVATSIAMKHLKTVSRFSPRVGRNVRLAEELIFMGHQRNSKNKGIAPGSLRTTGFDGAELPRHLVGTGSGFSGSANQTHFNLAQDLYDEKPSNLYTGKLGKGNTISQAFGSQRGHINTKLAPNRYNMLLNMVRSKIGRSPVVPDARSIALTNKWKRGYANGGMVGAYKGEPAPAQNGRYNMGGMVRGYALGGLVGGALLGTAGYMGGSALGGAIGGENGSMVGGMLGMMLSSGGVGKVSGEVGMLNKMLTKLSDTGLTKTVGPAAKAASSLRNVGGMAGMVAKGAAFLLTKITPLGIGLSVLAGGIALAIKLHKEHNEKLRINALGYGLTKEAAEKANLKFVDFNANMKTAIENSKALKERNKMLYESLTQANVPMKMTIEQYKKLRTEVKETMGDYIKLFDQTDKKDTGELAIRLKAQFMAAGDSAEVATAKVMVLAKESNKSAQAFSLIGQKSFQAIQTPEDAAVQTAKTFEKSMQSKTVQDGYGGTTVIAPDTKTAAQALLTAFQGIDTAIQDSISSSEKLNEKDKKAGKEKITAVKDLQTATAEQIARIKNETGTRTNLNAKLINELKKENPELAKVLNSTDDLISSWSKYQLIIQGVNVDVGSLSGAAATAALELNNIIQGIASASNNSITKDLTKKAASAKKAADDAAKAAKGQSIRKQIDDKAEIKSLNQKIDAINKEAAAKIKSLQKIKDAENDRLAMQKLQLQYQAAVASGNVDEQASLRIDMKQQSNDMEFKAAEQKYTDNAEKLTAPLIAALKKIQDGNDKLADKAALAGDSLESLQKKAADAAAAAQGAVKGLTDLAVGLTNNANYLNSDEAKGIILALKKATGKTEDQIIKEASKIRDMEVNTLIVKTMKEGTSHATRETAVDVKRMGDFAKDKNGFLDKPGKQFLEDGPEFKKLKEGEFLKYDGKYYRKDGDNLTRMSDPKKALGGPVIAGQRYTVNDRINSLGVQQEGFIPNVSGTIYPNSATMPRYDVPTNTISGVDAKTNNSYNNNTYTIDINLNGTNVTADDVMNKFEQKMALINAKKGRDRNYGGLV